MKELAVVGYILYIMGEELDSDWLVFNTKQPNGHMNDKVDNLQSSWNIPSASSD